MLQIANFLKRHSLVAGIVLMFLFTWPIDLSHSGLMPFEVPFPVYILVGYGFVVVSILMTWLTLGKDSVVKLLKRFLIWRVELRWYLAALLIMPAIEFLAVVISALYTQTPISFGGVLAYQIFSPTAKLPLLVAPFFIFDALTNGEEIGWRGYVLPRLQAKHNALTSTLILGLVWSLWHLPKYLSHWDTAAFIWSFPDIVAEAVLLTWLYNNTRGSLLLTTLFHASGNTAGVFLPVMNTVTNERLEVTIIETFLAIIAASVVIIATGPQHLSRTRFKEVLERQTDPIEGDSGSDMFILAHGREQ